MGIFSRPSWGDRMDKAAQAKAMPKGSWKEAVAKEEAADYERRVRRAKANHEKTKPYRGSKTEASHRGWFGKK